MKDGMQRSGFQITTPARERLTELARKPRYVIAVYELNRHYGGPEEGGWWFNSGQLIYVEPAYTYGWADHRAKVADEVYQDTHDLYSVNYPGHGAYSVRLVDRKARGEDYDIPTRFPEETPRYE